MPSLDINVLLLFDKNPLNIIILLPYDMFLKYNCGEFVGEGTIEMAFE